MRALVVLPTYNEADNIAEVLRRLRSAGTSRMSSRIIVEALLLVTWWGVRDLVGRQRAARPVVRARPTTKAITLRRERPAA